MPILYMQTSSSMEPIKNDSDYWEKWRDDLMTEAQEIGDEQLEVVDPLKFKLLKYGDIKDKFKDIFKDHGMVYKFLGKDSEGMSGMWVGGSKKVIGFFEGHGLPAHFTVEGPEGFVEQVKLFINSLPDDEISWEAEMGSENKEQKKIEIEVEWKHLKRNDSWSWKFAKKDWIRENCCTKCENYDKEDTDCKCDTFELWMSQDNPRVPG